MTCEHCHERPARYQLTRVVNGQTVGEVHLCERCAAEQGELVGGPDHSPSLQEFLAGLLGALSEGLPAGAAGAGPPAPATASCPRCGHTYAEFARTGLLGCPACYDAFSDALEPLIGRIHGKGRHAGKVPARAGSALRARRQLDALGAELRQAVSAERFEDAARLRDQIRALEESEVQPKGGER